MSAHDHEHIFGKENEIVTQDGQRTSGKTSINETTDNRIQPRTDEHSAPITSSENNIYIHQYTILAKEDYVVFFREEKFCEHLTSILCQHFSIEAKICDLRDSLIDIGSAYNVVLSGLKHQVESASNALSTFLSKSFTTITFGAEVGFWIFDVTAVNIVKTYVNKENITCIIYINEGVGLVTQFLQSDLEYFKGLCTTREIMSNIVNRTFTSATISIPRESDEFNVGSYVEELRNDVKRSSEESTTLIIHRNYNVLLFGLAGTVKRILDENIKARERHTIDRIHIELEEYKIDYLLTICKTELEELEKSHKDLQIVRCIRQGYVCGLKKELKEIVKKVKRMCKSCAKEQYSIDNPHSQPISSVESQRLSDIGVKHDCIVNSQSTERKEHCSTPKSFLCEDATSLSPAVMSIDIRIGDLSDQFVDMVVVASTSDYLMKNILERAGKSIRNEINAVIKNENIGVNGYETNGGKLLCKRLFFLPWTTEILDEETLRQSIRSFLTKAIQRAVNTHQTSLAFPAIGCGLLNYAPKVIAAMILDEAQRYASYNLKILIVILPKELHVYDAFCMKLSQIRKKLFSVEQEEISYRRPIISVTIVGPAEKISSCWKAIEDYSEKSVFKKQCGEFPLYIWNQEAIDTFYKYCLERAVVPNINPMGNFELAGPKEAVNDAEKEFYRIRTMKAEEAWVTSYSRTVAWWVQKSDTCVEKYSLVLNAVMENACASKHDSVTFKNSNGEQCRIDFNEMIEICEERKRRVIRNDFKVPSNWVPQHSEVIRWQLSPGEKEYQDVQAHFDKTMAGKYCDMQIERIQNQRWYTAYEIYGKYAKLKETELALFHGCPETSADTIIHSCFNRSFAGVNGVVYGIGVYFSKKASYSDQYTRPVLRTGVRCMFLAHVLIGETTLGKDIMKTPPEGFHSTTDKKHIFVTYHDDQAYASYLIKYKHIGDAP